MVHSAARPPTVGHQRASEPKQTHVAERLFGVSSTVLSAPARHALTSESSPVVVFCPSSTELSFESHQVFNTEQQFHSIDDRTSVSNKSATDWWAIS